VLFDSGIVFNVRQVHSPRLARTNIARSERISYVGCRILSGSNQRAGFLGLPQKAVIYHFTFRHFEKLLAWLE
jgi:hypothetical protein